MQQVWTPGLDSRREYDTWLGGILNAKESAIVFIDELAALVAEHKAPDNFERIIKLGRVVDLKRDKRISIIICTQEQAYMPRQALNQATHIVRFRLQSEYDARAVERAVGMRTEIAQPSTRWGFFHIRADNPGEYHEYSSPEEFFGKRVA